jgi:hypothetical protein
MGGNVARPLGVMELKKSFHRTAAKMGFVSGPFCRKRQISVFSSRRADHAQIADDEPFN